MSYCFPTKVVMDSCKLSSEPRRLRPGWKVFESSCLDGYLCIYREEDGLPLCVRNHIKKNVSYVGIKNYS